MKRRVLAGLLAGLIVFSEVNIGAFAQTTNTVAPSETVEVSTEDVKTETMESTEESLENEEESVPETESVVTTTESESVESESTTESESEEAEETVTGTEEVLETETETETETMTETLTEELTIEPNDSTTKTFLVDTESPYDGDIMLIANTNNDYYGDAESTGTLPVAEVAAVYADEVGENIFSDTDTDNIWGYDNWGRGMIDPASVLPELEYDGNSQSGAQYSIALSPEASYAVGSTKTLYLDTSSADSYLATECVCVAVGTYSTVWIPADDPIYLANPTYMKTQMQKLADEYDSKHPDMEEMFGSKEIVDTMFGDNDGKTALICYDIDGDGTNSSSYVAGYFFGADLDFGFSNATGNNMDCLHIDSWQGMGRNSTANTFSNVLASRGTIVHELQHMIHFSVCREQEADPNYYTITTPTYLNEAYSMAAEHLCYGAEEMEDRIWYYNSYGGYIASGNVSLFYWGYYDVLCNYSLSYLFGQYIRTQYGSSTVYKDAMAKLDSSNDLLSVIAELLNVTEAELLVNFRVALFLHSATGAYGFMGEEWAEDIRQGYVTFSGKTTSLDPGAAAVVPMSDTFTPSGAGTNIQFVGMYPTTTKDDVTVSVSGENQITEKAGTLQLSASVLPKGVSQSVIFSIPEEEEQAYATVTKDGLVQAITDGSVTVRATSVFNPEKYDEITIAISNQASVVLSKIEEELEVGYRVNYEITIPESGEGTIYYTTNGKNPTVNSDVLPEEGITFTTVGTHTLKVMGVSAGFVNSEVITSVYKVTQTGAPTIAYEAVEDGYLVSISAKEGETIAYTVDGTTPERGSTGTTVLYSEPFYVYGEGKKTVNAIAYLKGEVSSKTVSKSFQIGKTGPVSATPEEKEIVVGSSIALNCKNAESKKSWKYGTDYNIYYTLDGSDPVLNGQRYTEPLIAGNEPFTIRAVAKSLGSDTGEICEFTYEPYYVVEELTITNGENMTLYTNVEGKKEYTLQADISPLEAKERKINWKSSNPEVATVDENGVVTALQAGETIITASADNGSDSCAVTVKTAVESINILDSSLSIRRDRGTLQLNVQVLPENATDKSLTYEMVAVDGDKEQGIASVDENGLVKAIRNGTVKVVVTPKDNAAAATSVEAYITLSGQRSYNSTYMPLLSSKSITLNKKALNEYALEILPQGQGTVVTDAAFSETSAYAKYFSLSRETESNTWNVSLTEEGKANLKRGTYRLPLTIDASVAFGTISFEDTFTYSMQIRVVDSEPRVTADKITVNRFYSKTEYTFTMKSSEGKVTVLGLEDMESMPGFTENFALSQDGTMLVLNKPVEEFTEKNGRPVVKGYARVQVEGYEEQLVALTVTISQKAPVLITDNQKPVLNYSKIKEQNQLTLKLLEKIDRKTTKEVKDIVSVTLNPEDSGYKGVKDVVSVDVTEDFAGVIFTFDKEQVKAKTYRIPLLVSSGELVNIPLTVTVTVQRQTVEPKLTLEKTTVSLNKNYPNETETIRVKSISQANVQLATMETTAATDNKDEAVTLSWNSEKEALVAEITGTPTGSVYKFVCRPQYAGMVDSAQKITVTVKLHSRKASFSVRAKGSIDVLDRDNTSVVYTLTKTNFTDEIVDVTLVAPNKTSAGVRDGSSAFKVSEWKDNGATISVTIKAEEDFSFIKGKKYGFRLQAEKKNGLAGDESANKVLTSDATIKPVQSGVKFYVGKTPMFFRFVSESNNSQNLNLSTNKGTIQSVALTQNGKTPKGVSLQFEEATGKPTAIKFDGINGTQTSGSYNCHLKVVMEGQLCKEVNGEPIAEPMNCYVRIVIY